MATIEAIKSELNNFHKAVSVKAEVSMQEIREQNKNDVKWNHAGWEWCESSGVYYFRNDTEQKTLYIGKAAKFGDRIADHLNAEDAEWRKDISDPTTVIGFIPVTDEETRQELEKQLTQSLGTKHNIQNN